MDTQKCFFNINILFTILIRSLEYNGNYNIIIWSCIKFIIIGQIYRLFQILVLVSIYKKVSCLNA